MGRLSRKEPGTVPPEIEAIYDGFLQARGNVPNMIQTFAHRPKVLKTMVAHFKAVMEGTTVSVLLKEYLTLRVSTVKKCHY
jgi:hypothetical protein